MLYTNYEGAENYKEKYSVLEWNFPGQWYEGTFTLILI